MTKAKTVEEHFAEADRIQKHIRDANALVGKLKNELEATRRTLDILEQHQHPSVVLDCPYWLKEKNDKEPLSPKAMIQKQTERINALLGDRA